MSSRKANKQMKSDLGKGTMLPHLRGSSDALAIVHISRQLLAHPAKVRAIAEARIKIDKIDS